jgi:hypothetical protein
LLLLDEPLGALDKRLREAMQVELRAIQRKVGVTFLLVTHDQEEALSLSDRVAVMRHGKILQVAPPRTLYERPNCREVADFIGEINFFHATVRQITDAGVIVNAGILGIVTLPRANLTAGIKEDDHILLAIRPERVSFADAGVAGEVSSATFLGERNHFQVQIAGRREPVAVSAASAPVRQAVRLSFPPQHLISRVAACMSASRFWVSVKLPASAARVSNAFSPIVACSISSVSSRAMRSTWVKACCSRAEAISTSASCGDRAPAPFSMISAPMVLVSSTAGRLGAFTS